MILEVLQGGGGVVPRNSERDEEREKEQVRGWWARKREMGQRLKGREGGGGKREGGREEGRESGRG